MNIRALHCRTRIVFQLSPTLEGPLLSMPRFLTFWKKCAEECLEAAARRTSWDLHLHILCALCWWPLFPGAQQNPTGKGRRDPGLPYFFAEGGSDVAREKKQQQQREQREFPAAHFAFLTLFGPGWILLEPQHPCSASSALAKRTLS